MKVLYGISAFFTILGMIAGAVAFLAVVLGTIEATGAPPGGVLSGFVGGILALAAHALLGMAQGYVPGANWAGVLTIVFGLVGLARNRCRWYTPLWGLLTIAAAQLVWWAGPEIMSWLGSVSRWDAAVYWGAYTGSGVIVVGQALPWAVKIWKVCNSAPAAVGADEQSAHDGAGWMSYQGRVDFWWQVGMATWGKLAVTLLDFLFILWWVATAIGIGWNVWGVLGAVLGFFVGGWLLLRSVGSLVRAFFFLVSQSVISVAVMMPVATVVAIWQRVPAGEVAPALE